jgi:outer membrane lipoprotein-sorting protein
MRFRCTVLATGLVAVVVGAARADDSAAARALVNKAVEAQGGEAKLAKFPASMGKMKGTFHGMGQPIAFTGEIAVDGPSKRRLSIEAEANGQKFRFTHVLNGDKGWVKFNDQTMEMDKDQLATAKAEAYTDWVSTLLPLKDKAFTLATVGEANIGKRPALGITVSSKGRSDVNLYFDKQTGLLVKIESRVTDAGQEKTEETLVDDYKEVQGIKLALKFTVNRDGKLYLEGEVTESTPAEKLDDSLFEKP